ncbi:MAG: aminotransferase [Aquincola sp.]|nr:aminotransferase [Aquincola sp.]MDH5330102.1 aminotransferase [Aquincola sp.]
MNMPRFNPLVASLSTPPIPSIQRWAQAYDASLGPLIDLSQAVPGYPPHPRLLAALAEAAGSARTAGYGAIEGEDALRTAYAHDLNALYGGDVVAADVHVTAGCNQAFAAAVLALIGPGEQVALLSPFYFNHQTTLAMLGIGCVGIDCHAAQGFVPDLADIESALAPAVRALVLITPNNPTGAVYPPPLLRDIFDLCRRRGLWLIVDETYRDFLPPDPTSAPPHALFRDEDWRSHLVALYSFSKSFCIPGHRVGALTAGPSVVAQVAKVMDNLQICAPRAPQVALARALAELADWRKANRVEIASRARCFRETLAAVPDWRIDAIGAYFAYVRHPFVGLDAEPVARRLATEVGVLTVPGSYFGERQPQYLRMAFANADSATIGCLSARLKALGA